MIQILFKLDLNGNGILLEQRKVLEHKQFRKRLTLDHFTKMCILSGCDYLQSLPGIGLAKSCKFMCQNINSSDVGAVSVSTTESVRLCC